MLFYLLEKIPTSSFKIRCILEMFFVLNFFESSLIIGMMMMMNDDEKKIFRKFLETSFIKLIKKMSHSAVKRKKKLYRKNIQLQFLKERVI